MIVIVFGVSGSGKTTTGQLLAEQLNLPFYDADDYHPPANIAKMSNGLPLKDEDRIPWLEELADQIRSWSKGKGAVLACSALKESYREVLQVADNIHWVYLKGSRETIQRRMLKRENHYMKADLLESQLNDLQPPSYGIEIDISYAPQLIVKRIMERLNADNFNFGVIGMGVMGKNLALNLAEKGGKVAIYNRHVAEKEEGIAQAVADEHADLDLLPFDDLENFVSALASPRVILLMIPAGAAVDLQIESLLPLLHEDDVIIDGGNSFYKDSERRAAYLLEKGIHFLPMGISGGEEGARKGPSMMPGGTLDGYKLAMPYLEQMAAVDRKGKACITHVGPGGAGHFVKMVHNSIEYGEMQLLAEVYHILRHCWKYEPMEIADVLEDWKDNGLDSFLLEITISILRKKEGEDFLLDMILDKAEQKGTGGWSVNVALEYGVPYGPLVEAVMARNTSSRKDFRTRLSKKIALQPEVGFVMEERPDQLKNAFAMVSLLNHAVGFDLIKTVSDENDWQIDLSEVSRIWTNGCIIRSSLMEDLVRIFKEESHLLHAKSSLDLFGKCQEDLALIVGQTLGSGHAVPVMSSALNYYLGQITENSPANLIQAQRDFFGAHTYQRVDRGSDEYFHTEWLGDD